MKSLGRIIYIDNYGHSIGVENDRLYIRDRSSDDKTYVHLIDLDAVIVNNRCSVSTQALVMLAQKDIPFIVTDGLHNFVTQIELKGVKNVFLRKAQVLTSNDSETVLEVSKFIVQSKIESMALFHEFKDVAVRLEKISHAASYEQLLGYEGDASKEYFKYIRSEFAKVGYSFHERNFYPPLDPANSILSMSYMLLFSEILTISKIFGFDSRFGYLHRDYYGRDSLICDLI